MGKVPKTSRKYKNEYAIPGTTSNLWPVVNDSVPTRQNYHLWVLDVDNMPTL
jgi:hypothetical protein